MFLSSSSLHSPLAHARGVISANRVFPYSMICNYNDLYHWFSNINCGCGVIIPGCVIKGSVQTQSDGKLMTKSSKKNLYCQEVSFVACMLAIVSKFCLVAIIIIMMRQCICFSILQPWSPLLLMS